MAKLEIILPEKDEYHPASAEEFEVRVWGLGGESHQTFELGNGVNFNGKVNIWIEIIYTVNGVDFFRTRNYLHRGKVKVSRDELQASLERFTKGEITSIGFRGILPETSIHLIRENGEYKNLEGKTIKNVYYHLEIVIDTASLFGKSGPSNQTLALRFNYIKEGEAIQFMRDLNEEVANAYEGKRPDPASVELGKNEWRFVRELNQKAYDDISQRYQEEYFSNPALTEMFDTWANDIPLNGLVLDVGCGHGDPVISRLLEKNLQVTGADLSLKMLERARANFPTVNFIHQTAREIQVEAEYDGICSLSSLLYFDPIDLSHSLYRLYHALKPGGLLFLYACDLHPAWRGRPYRIDIGQWLWAWTYSMNEAVRMLEEHGYFKTLRVENVTTEEYKQKQAELWRENQQKKYDKRASYDPSAVPPDLSNIPNYLAYNYAIIARRS